MQRLNPLNDFIFKKLMGEEETKENLISFLNAVLSPDTPNRLVTLELIENKELTQEMLYNKTGRLDVRAQTADGTQIDIEVQLTNQRNMDKRTMFYWGKLFLEGIGRGEDYNRLNKVITVNLLDFTYLDVERFHTTYHLWEDHEETFMLTDLIEIHFIELPKFRRIEKKNLSGNPLHRWLRFFDKNISEEELKELMDMDPLIRKTEKRLEHLSSDPKLMELYKAREDSLHERANMISSAKEEGREEGKIEGKQNAVVTILETKFPEYISSSLIEKVTRIQDEERLNELLINIAKIEDYKDIEELLG